MSCIFLVELSYWAWGRFLEQFNRNIWCGTNVNYYFGQKGGKSTTQNTHGHFHRQTLPFLLFFVSFQNTFVHKHTFYIKNISPLKNYFPDFILLTATTCKDKYPTFGEVTTEEQVNLLEHLLLKHFVFFRKLVSCQVM